MDILESKEARNLLESSTLSWKCARGPFNRESGHLNDYGNDADEVDGDQTEKGTKWKKSPTKNNRN